MMRFLRLPFHLLRQAIVLPTRALIASLGLTFRLGFKAGALPVRGGAAVSRALGWKILGAVTLGMVIGVLIGRQVERQLHRHDHDHRDDGPGVVDVIENEVAA